LNAGEKISFSIDGILNPVSKSSTDSFTITTWTTDGYQLDSRSTGITVKMTTTDSLSSVSVVPTSTVNGAENLYTFSFQAKSPLKDGDKIFIRSPNTVIPPVTPICKGTSQLAANLAWNTLNQELFVTLSFTPNSQIDPEVSFSFTIENFKNPSSTEPSAAFYFEAQDSAGSLINSNTGNSIIQTNTPATITTANVDNELKDALAVTTFQITFTNIHQIPINGVIIITYPSEVSPSDAATSTITCSSNIANSPTWTHDAVNRKVTITNIITPV
jgi:hypothetical protein